MIAVTLTFESLSDLDATAGFTRGTADAAARDEGSVEQHAAECLGRLAEALGEATARLTPSATVHVR